MLVSKVEDIIRVMKIMDKEYCQDQIIKLHEEDPLYVVLNSFPAEIKKDEFFEQIPSNQAKMRINFKIDDS